MCGGDMSPYSVSGAQPQPPNVFLGIIGTYVSAGWGKVTAIFSAIRPKSGGYCTPIPKSGKLPLWGQPYSLENIRRAAAIGVLKATEISKFSDCDGFHALTVNVYGLDARFGSKILQSDMQITFLVFRNTCTRFFCLSWIASISDRCSSTIMSTCSFVMWSNQLMFSVFLQIHISHASSLVTSSFLRVHVPNASSHTPNQNLHHSFLEFFRSSSSPLIVLLCCWTLFWPLQFASEFILNIAHLQLLYTVSQKNGDTIFLSISLLNIDQFSQFFHRHIQ